MNTRVVIGIPSLGGIQTETVASLFQAAPVMDFDAQLIFHTSCYIHDARNKIAQEAIDKGASHLMFIDSDIKFPPDGVNRLLKQDKDIIGGLYYRRQPPHMPTINQLENDKIVIPHTFPTDKTFEAFAVATGFMLIKTEVFKKVSPPWFFFGNYKGMKMGEDVYFCWKAKQKGYKVFVDPTIALGHVGGYVFTSNDFKAYEDARPKGNVLDEFDGQIK